MQQQNPAEAAIRIIKRQLETLMDRTGAPDEAWLLALEYICHVHNKTSSKVLGWKTPWEVRTGETPDISEVLPFEFWEQVYYKPNNDDKEQLGHFVGFAEHVGDSFCFKVLTENGQVISRSKVRSARDQSHPNNRVYNQHIPVSGSPLLVYQFLIPGEGIASQPTYLTNKTWL